jgi:drug/metabolite transporter (DMT)-like permease
MQNMTTDRYPHALAGLAMGGGAILLWSLSSACVVFAGKQMGVWQFLAITSLTSGFLQVVGYLVLGRNLRSILMPPPKLWLATALGFILYLLLYTTGLVVAHTETQAVGVNLMNYLWPTLAILFTTGLVPGERMHGRLALAIAFSLAGVLIANSLDLALPDSGTTAWPYALGGAAAVSWAAYCALTSRWRRWAKDYAAAPMGFVIVGAIAAAVCCGRHEWQPSNGCMWATVLLTALGPWAGGYMLWEMALHRASAITLGLMGSATPVLSTMNLIGLFALTAPGRLSGTRVAVLLAASVMIGVAVALGTSSSAGQPQMNAETQ